MEALIALFVLGAGGVTAWGLLLGPIGRAVARWIEARTPHAHGQLMAEISELEGRVTRLERLLRESAAARSARTGRVRPD